MTTPCPAILLVADEPQSHSALRMELEDGLAQKADRETLVLEGTADASPNKAASFRQKARQPSPPGSGQRIRAKHAAFDAEKKSGIGYTAASRKVPEIEGCAWGSVMTGKRKASDGKGCAPDMSLGVLMVSSELAGDSRSNPVAAE